MPPSPTPEAIGQVTKLLSIQQLRHELLMDFNYKWKHGYPPSKEQAVGSKYLLDKSQFDNEQDRNLAEEQARKHLNLPTRVPDDDRSILPHSPQEGSGLDADE